jgi:hypothetical protein
MMPKPDPDAVARYDAGLAAWHAQHDAPEHLTAAAIVDCPLCDDDGYRGTHVCDHTDHAAAAKRGRAACQAALSKGDNQ